MKAPHIMLFADTINSPYKFVALAHHKDSCVLAWPAKIETIARTNIRHVVMDIDVDRPNLEVIHDINKLAVWHFSYKSYAGIWHDHPPCRSTLKPGLGSFQQRTTTTTTIN